METWEKWLLIATVGYFGYFIPFGFQLRRDLGPVKDHSQETYQRLTCTEENLGIIRRLVRAAACPFWQLAYLLLGDPPLLPHQIPKPPEPDEDKWQPPDIEDTLLKVRSALNLKYNHIPEPILEAVISTSRRMLVKDYTPGTDSLMARSKFIDAYHYPLHDRLFDSFDAFIKRSLITPAGSLSVTVPEWVSTKDVSQLFYDLSRNNLFPDTYSDFCRTEGFGRELTRKTLTNVSETIGLTRLGDRDGVEHVAYLLRSYPELRELELFYGLPKLPRFEGTWIVAPQGRGKTTLLSALFKDDLAEVAEGKASIILMGSKGDMTDHVKQLEVFAPGNLLEGKLTFIEPSGDLSINPLDIGNTTGHTIALLEYVFAGLLETHPAPKQLLVLRKLILACRSIPNANLMTVREILIHGWVRYAKEIGQTDDLTREFFETGKFDDKEAGQTKEALAWRIEDLITRVDILKEMFKATKTKLDMASLMDKPNVVVIDNSMAILTEKGAEFFGRFFIALILGAAQQRAQMKQEDKLPVYVYIDEAADIIAKDRNIATIIQTCRSQNIAIMFAHQNVSQIDDEKVLAALNDCALCFSNTSDANLPKGKFILEMRDHFSFYVTVHKESHVSNWPKMSEKDFASISAEMTSRFHRDTVPQSEVPADDPGTDAKPWK